MWPSRCSVGDSSLGSLWPLLPFVQPLSLYFPALLFSLVVTSALYSLLTRRKNSGWLMLLGSLELTAVQVSSPLLRCMYPKNPVGWWQRSEGETTRVGAN